MKKAIIPVLLSLSVLAPSACYANAFDGNEDKAAHFGVSYVINDQLQDTFHVKPFAAALATVAIGFAKEAFVDDHFDKIR